MPRYNTQSKNTRRELNVSIEESIDWNAIEDGEEVEYQPSVHYSVHQEGRKSVCGRSIE
jgi:hypothetical protein